MCVCVCVRVSLYVRVCVRGCACVCACACVPHLLQCACAEAQRAEEIVVGDEGGADPDDNHGPLGEEEDRLPPEHVRQDREAHRAHLKSGAKIGSLPGCKPEVVLRAHVDGTIYLVNSQPTYSHPA